MIRRMLPLLALAGACSPAGAPSPATPIAVRAASAPGVKEASPELAGTEPIDGVAAPSNDAAPLAQPPRRHDLGVGRSVVELELPPGRLASVGVFGERDALLGFDLAASELGRALRAHAPLDEDGVLPRIVSLRTPAEGAVLSVVVDAASPVFVELLDGDAAVVPPGSDAPPVPRPGQRRVAPPLRPLVGLPQPAGREDGYVLQSPARYQFLRADAARSLLAALRQTRIRFRRDPIAVADASQWDGRRPATDQGKPRHISHEGGRDIDVALPANDDEPSTVRHHCTPVLVERDVEGCAPGSGRGVDARRLAYLLGLLVGGPVPVERIYTDDVYVRMVKKALGELHERRWISAEAFAALDGDGLLRASPWHTNHLHVRFAGAAAIAGWSTASDREPVGNSDMR